MRKEKKMKLNKKSVCAGMAFTLASAVLAATLSQTGQSMTAYAKETFRGIDQVVEEHESEPFVILDVVPGDASAKWTDDESKDHDVSLSMGTIGYLVDGQAPIEQDLLLAFTKEEEKALFYNCANRERLTKAVLPDGFASGNPEDINILYEEAYGGVVGMETDEGWIKLYDPVENPSEDTTGGATGGTTGGATGGTTGGISGSASGGTSSGTTGSASGGTSADTSLPHLKDVPTGVFEGVYAKYDEDAGGDRSGYDYKYVSGDNGSPQTLDADGNLGGPVFKADDKNGEYRVAFEAYREGVRGYVPVTETTDLSAYSDNTSIYRKENGVYVYYGQIKDVRPSEEQDKIQEIPVDPDNPNGNAGEEDGSDDETVSGNDIDKGDSEKPEDSGQTNENNSSDDGSNGTGVNSGTGSSTGTGSGDTGTVGNGTSIGSGNSGNGTDGNSGTGSNNDGTGAGGGDTGTGDNGTSVGDGDSGNGTGGNSGTGSGTGTGTVSGNDAPQTSARAAGKPDGWRLLVSEDGNADTDIDADTSTDTNTDTSTDSNADDEFYVVLFRYEEEPDESQMTYQAGSVYQVADGDQVIRPYDLYSLEESGEELANSVEMFALGGTAAGVPEEVTFRYVGSGNGDYKLAKADENTSDSHIIKVENAPVYFRCVNSRDWLKQYVFGQQADSSFGIEVRTRRADQVTAEEVEEADLVFLEAGGTDFLNANVTAHYITTEDIADMSEEAVFTLLYSVANEAKPIIVDYDIIADDTSVYKDSGYRKMAGLFLKTVLSAYMEEMGNDLDDMYMNADKDIKSDNTFHYVNKNIYVLNESVGGMLVAGDFIKPFDSETADRGFEEIIATIEMENMSLPENDKMPLQISKAVAVQYIINYAVGLVGNFERLNILELQPSSNETPDLYFEESGENNSAKLIWKKKDSGLPGQQLLRSNKGIEHKSVTVKSVARFNSEWEDLNSSYDMIFIGLDGQRLNRENRTGYTVYNDESLNKKVYHSGDHASGTDERYDANDITPQKARALIEYLRAGYPVVVEDAFFTDGTAKGAREEDINTDYIGSGTEMYRFLKKVLTDDELLNHKNFYTVSDVWGNAYFTAQINMRKPNLSYSEEQDFVVQTLTRGENGEYYGVIEYTVSDGLGDGYAGDTDIRMYIDWNNDGIFSEKEILSSDQYTESDGAVTLALKDVSEGVFMWKLEVYDTGNMYRRDSLEGCFRCVGDTPAKIKILQIVDESDLDNPAVNLQKIFETENNSLLAVTLKNAEGMINASYEIKSVTVSQLLEEMNREQAGEGYLKKWDVIVLGFGTPTDLSGIRDLLVSYVGSGGSMLVSSAGAKTGTGRLGFDASFLGQTERKTYVNLGASSGGYYRYDGLKGEMFEPKTWNIGVSLNKGIISYYPYVIDETIDIVQANRAADYLLDFDGNYSEDGGIADTCVTAWYTFSGSNVNRNAYSVSEKDGRNNYYVYSKGNVVYVGQESYPYIYGETEDWNGDLEGTDECRIFVNALMAAYNSGVHAPDISIVAGFGSNQASIRSITIPFDQDLRDLGDATNGVLDETVDVYFMYMDNNLVFNKSMSLSFFWENDAGTPVDIGGRTIHATEFSSKIWAVEDNQLVEVSAGQLEPGTVYKIKAPAVALKENSSITNADIYIVLTTSLYKNDRDRSMVNNAFVTLNRAQLFLLE